LSFLSLVDNDQHSFPQITTVIRLLVIITHDFG
jgi:hypothetical protein